MTGEDASAESGPIVNDFLFFADPAAAGAENVFEYR